MSVTEDRNRLIEFSVSKYGKISNLVLNHALQTVPDFWIGSRENETNLRTMFETNFFSYQNLASGFLNEFGTENGNILVISSGIGIFPMPFYAPYAASKHALQGFFSALQHELYMKGSAKTITMGVIGRTDTEKQRGMTAAGNFVRHGNYPPAANVKEVAEKLVKSAINRENLGFIDSNIMSSGDPLPPPSKEGTPVEQANPISKKLNKILDSKIETDQEMLNSLGCVSEFFESNTLQNRRNLRRDIESRSLQTNIQFLNSFKAVTEQLEMVAAAVGNMSACCETMTHRLKATKGQTRDLINQTTKMQSQSKRVDKRLEVVNGFLAAFQLSPAEVKALKGNEDGSIGRQFFPALNRVREIHADCKYLLRSNQHTAGLEIMEKMANHQEAAYELLYRWIQRECRLLNVDYVELNPVLCQALHAMHHRPVLFTYSLDEYSTARRNNMVRGFIDALTRGGPGGVPKPIELLSHDCLRYSGDMLAWVHQSIMSDKDLLMALLKFTDQEDIKDKIPNVLTHITEGLCRPFKVRVEQVLSGENGPVILYRLSNMFIFYQETIAPLLAADAHLVRTVNELKELTLNMFYTSLHTSVQRILDRLEPPGPGLLPVTSVQQVLLLLRDVLESHDATLVPVTDKQENFTKIFVAVLDPLQQSLLLSAVQLDAVDLAVYTLNCLSALHALISLYQYTDKRLEIINAQIEAHEDVLVSEQAGSIVGRTGLSRIYGTCNSHNRQVQGPIQNLQDMDVLSLQSALEKFDLFLSSPDRYTLQQCQLLTSNKIRENVNGRTWCAVSGAYAVIFDKIHDPSNNYEQPTKLMPKSAEQVKQLLVGS